MDNSSGRRWARGFLVTALAVSLVGNIAHTVLATSDISLWLRVPGAVVWPVFAFGGIEILVRVIWSRTLSHRFSRAMILLPVLPAAITSYEHLRSLLLMMGERPFIATIGPAAIDGMMVGCTLVLLFTRPEIVPTSIDLDEMIDRYGIGDWDTAVQTELVEPLPETPVSPAPIGERRTRSRWDARRVCELAIDGVKAPAAHEQTGIGQSTYARYLRVARQLQTDPRAAIDVTAKVPADHIDLIRKLVTR